MIFAGDFTRMRLLIPISASSNISRAPLRGHCSGNVIKLEGMPSSSTHQKKLSHGLIAVHLIVFGKKLLRCVRIQSNMK